MHQDDEREREAEDAKEREEKSSYVAPSRSNIVEGKVSSGAEFYIFRANKAEQVRYRVDTFMCDVHINVRKADDT